jgi:hypothetical protein
MYTAALLTPELSLAEARITVKSLNAINQDVFFKLRQNSS